MEQLSSIRSLSIGFIDGRTLEEMSNSANRLESWVSSQIGPTPVLDEEIKELFYK